MRFNSFTAKAQALPVYDYGAVKSFRSTAGPSLKINTSEYDFLLGRWYFQIAIEGRS
ncbi:MAG TPA: hypothetical protein VGP58_02870 [Pyrinomonadaceae bacterium]|nr:hypothetical protein [Pyrinomonadaceae bacterium]